VLIRPAFALALTVITCSATPALAQRFPCEQRFDMRDAEMLDVSTVAAQSTSKGAPQVRSWSLGPSPSESG
jgi:hypothetical protein